MPRIHIRRENGTWTAISGTEAPRHGDITVTFDQTFNEAEVENFRTHIANIHSGLGLPPIYPSETRLLGIKVGSVLMLCGILALVSFVGAAMFLYLFHESYPRLSFLVAALWTIAVPIYFFWEHEYVYVKFGDPLQYDQFKRVQDLATKIWVGALTVLGTIVALKLSSWSLVDVGV